MNKIEIERNDVIRFTEVTPNNFWTIKWERGSGYAYKDKSDACIGHVNKDWLLWMIKKGSAELIKSKSFEELIK
jgi:hypothetical protein